MRMRRPFAISLAAIAVAVGLAIAGPVTHANAVAPADTIAAMALPEQHVSRQPIDQVLDRFSFTGGSGKYSYSVASGVLPAGLKLDEGSGTISGRPTGDPGVYTVTLRATDRINRSNSGVSPQLTIDNFGMWDDGADAPLAPPACVVGKDYKFRLTTAGSDGPVQFAIVSGSLPAGLDFADGVISGKPTDCERSSAVVTATTVHLVAGTAATQSDTATLMFAPAGDAVAGKGLVAREGMAGDGHVAAVAAAVNRTADDAALTAPTPTPAAASWSAPGQSGLATQGAGDATGLGFLAVAIFVAGFLMLLASREPQRVFADIGNIRLSRFMVPRRTRERTFRPAFRPPSHAAYPSHAAPKVYPSHRKTG